MLDGVIVLKYQNYFPAERGLLFGISCVTHSHQTERGTKSTVISIEIIRRIKLYKNNWTNMICGSVYINALNCTELLKYFLMIRSVPGSRGSHVGNVFVCYLGFLFVVLSSFLSFFFCFDCIFFFFLFFFVLIGTRQPFPSPLRCSWFLNSITFKRNKKTETASVYRSWP